MKKNTYYFSHDYNAANDVKVLFLRQQLGMEGYGIYWYLVESLASAEQFQLFVIEAGTFKSLRLSEHLNLRKGLADKGKEGAFKRWGNRVANGEANANKNKGNEIKEINKIVI